jgi:hypothetical protein
MRKSITVCTDHSSICIHFPDHHTEWRSRDVIAVEANVDVVEAVLPWNEADGILVLVHFLNDGFIFSTRWCHNASIQFAHRTIEVNREGSRFVDLCIWKLRLCIEQGKSESSPGVQAAPDSQLIISECLLIQV